MKAKKHFGQHYLRSARALEQIVEAGGLTPRDIVLEIGPGEGVLTEKLLERASKVIAVEKDRDLIEPLATRFKQEISSGKLVLLQADVLDLSPETMADLAPGYKLIANIPYYITGAILEKFLSGALKPSRAVLLVQKEVAERILARDGRGSILSISVKAYGKPRITATVGRGAFAPQPEVDSAILLIEDISKDFFTNIDEKNFFTIVKTGFGKKRKQLLGNLSALMSRERLAIIFEELKLTPTVRAEELGTETWRALTEKMCTFMNLKNYYPQKMKI